jgi:hypothetical protein
VRVRLCCCNRRQHSLSGLSAPGHERSQISPLRRAPDRFPTRIAAMLARAPPSIKEVLSRAEPRSHGQDWGQGSKPLAARVRNVTRRHWHRAADASQPMEQNKGSFCGCGIPRSAIRVSNVELERPVDHRIRALRAHNNPGAHSAPHQLSRPLQALVRNPPHRKPLCACGYSPARGTQ